MRYQIMFFNHLFILYLLLGLLVPGDVFSGDKPPRGRMIEKHNLVAHLATPFVD